MPSNQTTITTCGCAASIERFDAHVTLQLVPIANSMVYILLRAHDAYLKRQLPSFLEGNSPPDFPADHFEADFVGRVTEGDLTAPGRSQMGLDV